MELYQWFFKVLGEELQSFGVPEYLAFAIVKSLESAITEESVQAFETKVKLKLADELRALQAANPQSLLTAEVVSEACKLLAS